MTPAQQKAIVERFQKEFEHFPEIAESTSILWFFLSEIETAVKEREAEIVDLISDLVNSDIITLIQSE